jgi:hypothetical protein
MPSRPLLLASLALLLLAIPGHAQEKHLLRMHWQPGKIYRFETNMDMEMTMPPVPGLPGVGGPQSSTMIMHTDVTVRKEPGTDRKLAEMKITGIKTMMNANGQIKTYDSNDPAMSEPELQQAFGAVANKSITIVYDKDDRYVEDIIPKDFVQTPVGGIQGPDGKQIAAMIRHSVEMGLPNEPIAVGATCSSEKKLDMPPVGAMTTRLKGRLDSIVTHEGRKHARILMDGTVEMPGLPAGPAGAQAPTKVSSETLFDLERKTISRSTARTETRTDHGEIKMTMTQTSTTTLKSLDPAPPEKK